MKVRPGLEIASLTDVGCQRENNEDSYGYWEPQDDADFERLGRLAVIADGMGGHEGGQIASRIAVENVQQAYVNSAQADPQNRLLEAFHEIHRHIQHHARQNPVLLGMGTTCTAFALVGNHLYYAHVGDSRLYLLRGGNRLRLLTSDHTLVARLLETGAILPENADSHPQRHVLTSAVGVADDIDPDFSAEPLVLQKSDVLLLCTDGLWGQISDSEIQQILSSKSSTDACRTLVQLAKKRGGPDNITLQIARIT
jgi:serine/threonine protein phosphatase PrpC